MNEQQTGTDVGKSYILPELKSGDMLVSPNERIYCVLKVSPKSQKRNTGYDEPLYRLARLVLASKEWQLEELQKCGMRELQKKVENSY